MTAPERFDEAYYRRFYGDPETRVIDAKAVGRLAEFVSSYLRHLDLPLRSALDIGCGLGLWQTALREIHPRIQYRGVEISSYLCEKHGWEQSSVVDYRSNRQFDLVVCQGVLQYLDDAAAAKAIENLASLTRGVLFLEALTVNDWEENCDREITDGDVQLRTGTWYRSHLEPHFVAAGGGLFVAKSTAISMFELETT